MKIELNIDNANAGTVEEVFKSLTPEQRVIIAESIMRQFLLEPHNGERLAFRNSEIARLGKYGGSDWIDGCSRSYTSMTPEQITRSEKFKEAMKNYKSTRDTMLEEITKTAVTAYRAKVEEFVKTDPQLQEVMKLTLEAIRADFPKFAHDALMAWFVQNMQAMGDGMLKALFLAENSNQFAERITKQLRERTVTAY